MDKFYDFTNCELGHKQYGGSDEKKTIFMDGARYMLKFPEKIPEEKRNSLNSSSRNNIFSEYVACHIIEAFGIPVQETLLGTYTDSDGITRNVVACKDFCTDGYELNEFEKYKSSYRINFKNVQYPDIDDVIDAICKYENEIKDEAIERFWDTFALDTLLGNFDRHTGNWGYLYNDNRTEDRIKNAPIYDCGSCLYPMASDHGMEIILTDRNKIDERIYTFPKTAFAFDGSQLSYQDFFELDYAKKNPDVKKSFVKIAELYDKEKIKSVIDNTPAITDICRDFYVKMIQERYDKLIIQNLEQKFLIKAAKKDDLTIPSDQLTKKTAKNMLGANKDNVSKSLTASEARDRFKEGTPKDNLKHKHE